MNLLYTITAYPPSKGGAQLFTHKLIQKLISQAQVQVLSLWDKNRTDWLMGTTIRMPEDSMDYEIDQVPVHRLGISVREKWSVAPYVLLYYPFMNSAVPRIAATLQRRIDPFAARADLVHNVRIGREPISFASLQAARKYDIPFILSPLHHPRWVGWRYHTFHKIYQMADALIALTNSEKQTLIELGIQEDKIFVTGNGPILSAQADPQKFLSDHQIHGPMVLFLGQHYSYKGFRQVLEAARLVWKRVPEAHFVFIGPSVGDSEKYFRAFEDHRICRLGTVTEQEKTNALAACYLLCVPSTQESFGGVYTEAWWFRKPVIGCRIPAVSEVVSDGVDGLLVDQKTDQICESICQLLLDARLAQEMGAAGRRKVDEKYTWERLVERTMIIYQKVCEK